MAGRVAPPGGRPIAVRVLTAGALLWLAGRSGAIMLDDPDHFQVKRTWSAMDLGVPAPLGGLVFTTDGDTLYIVGDADEAGSALYALPVARDPAGQVTDFGSGTLAFAGTAGLDAGLERGPGGTLFYAYFTKNQLGERPGGVGGAESAFDLGPQGVPAAISGLTFSPIRIDLGTGFGCLQISTSFGSDLLEIPLVAVGAEVFAPLAASVFVTLPLASIAGLQYVPAGTLAGNLIYANFDEGQLRVLTIDRVSGLPIDAHSGEPVLGTTSPADRVFASAFGVGPLGLEFDPRIGNDLFVTTFGGNPTDSLIQIGGFAGTFATTTTSTTSSTSLTTEPPPTSTSATTASTATTATSATSTVPSTAPSTSSTTVSTSTSTLPTTTAPTPTSSSTTTSISTTSSATTPPTSSTSTSVSVTSTSVSLTSTSMPVTSTSSSSATSSSTSSSTTSSTAVGSSSTTSTTAPDVSTTTVSSTSSSSLAPVTTSTSTSTVSSLPPTTSTSAPVVRPTTTIPSACERVPTFASVRCRLANLARKIDDSRAVVGPLEGPLVRRVQRAGRRAGMAEERASAGQTRRARRLVRRVLVELRAFEAALASSRARAVPENVRAELAAVAGELRVDLRALRASL